MAEYLKELTFEQRDEFSRKQIAEKVSTLLTSTVDVSPMVIDGSWGTGKSEFCHKLINLMREADTHHLIYVDAFQADHADEPLLTVLAEVIKILPDEEAQQSFIQKALPAARYGLKTLGKAAVGHLLKQEAAGVVDGFEKEIQQAANKVIDVSVETMLKDHVKASESLATLQATLKEIAGEKPIVLFIDELDRCRPNFAVHMLEIIKHTFDVDGVQFVLITNTQQLKASINHCYGDSVQAQSYLDKFIKFTFSLSKSVQVNRFNEIDAAKKHFSLLVESSPLLSETLLAQDDSSALALVWRCIEHNKLSLREVERLARYLKIYQELTESSLSCRARLSNNLHTFYIIKVYAVCLTSILPDVANEVISQQSDAKSLVSLIGLTMSPSFEGEERVSVHDMIATLLAQECELNKSDYLPSEAVKERFDEMKQMCFHGDFTPDEGDLIKALRSSLKNLSLMA